MLLPGDKREAWADSDPLGGPAPTLKHKVRRELLHEVDPVKIEQWVTLVSGNVWWAVRPAQVEVGIRLLVDQLAGHREQLEALLRLLEKKHIVQ